MKLVILCLVSLFSIAWGERPINDLVENNTQFKHLNVKLTDIVNEDNLESFLEALKKFVQDGDVSGIFNLKMNPTIDEAIDKLRAYFISCGFDPLELDDQKLQLLGIIGSIKLTSGWLQDISTISRNDDVIVSYNSATKKVAFTLPLKFNVLLFTYKYVTRVTLLKIKGDVLGKIQDVVMNLNLIFDGSTGKFVLKSVSMKDSGKITVKFSGHSLVDWITNAMTSVITEVLHPLLISMLQSGAMSVGNDITDAVNEYIKNHF
ncbi:unnamed protein product [Ceutorhynchus assimilis]|uniref:Uncharacterized protein n=1 Tax=Ceutorhynchus assimilis TaxID=467358 RepID=A0A9N9QL27_9CUCU|nr:unnamed protein product [Ceutorhynchus assimilis]